MEGPGDEGTTRHLWEGRGHSVDLGLIAWPPLHTASVLGTLTQAGLLDRVTPEQLFVSVQDAAAHALERLVRG